MVVEVEEKEVEEKVAELEEEVEMVVEVEKKEVEEQVSELEEEVKAEEIKQIDV
jgi:hypothetical protein